MSIAWNVKPEVILLVDSESGTRALCRKILIEEGYTVLEADSGFEALIVAGEHGGQVDLLLTDSGMPRITGVQLARAFERLWPHVPVMYLADRASPPRYPNRGATVIAKPLVSILLKQRIDDLFGNPKVAAAPGSVH
jgi:two-component system cell cycle sensor histidine kinase/response regulator CckA